MSEKTVSRKRRLLTNVLTAVLVLGAIGGGVAYTAVTVDGADRSAPTVGWAEPTVTTTPSDPAAGFAKGRASTPLSKLLLPVPDGYVLGADVKGHGNDHELAAKEASALFKQTNKGLYGKKRRAYEKEIDKLGIQGMAMRSYASVGSTLQVEVLVLRMKDKGMVRQFSGIQKGMFEFLELREGPKIKDHEKNAACFLAPEPRKGDKKERAAELRSMICQAYDGEVMVTVTAYGAVPFGEQAVAELVKKQLDHIESPGEYV
ncbi:hypothetical protein ABZY68_28675 [Streptomyces sp. NPDC006482]|uniref:hypothetical protein n=1 Tax=Streptomyces sp. NPDC006482 TaxID=3154306 RepID=UPI0033BB841B